MVNGLIDALLVGEEGFTGGDGGKKVGHDDGAGEVAGTQGGCGLEHVTIPQVEMHVERGVEGHRTTL